MQIQFCEDLVSGSDNRADNSVRGRARPRWWLGVGSKGFLNVFRLCPSHGLCVCRVYLMLPLLNCWVRVHAQHILKTGYGGVSLLKRGLIQGWLNQDLGEIYDSYEEELSVDQVLGSISMG